MAVCIICGNKLDKTEDMCKCCGIKNKVFVSKTSKKRYIDTEKRKFWGKSKIFAGYHGVLLLTPNKNLYSIDEDDDNSMQFISENVRHATLAMNIIMYVTMDGVVHMKTRGAFRNQYVEHFPGLTGAIAVFSNTHHNIYGAYTQNNKMYIWGEWSLYSDSMEYDIETTYRTVLTQHFHVRDIPFRHDVLFQSNAFDWRTGKERYPNGLIGFGDPDKVFWRYFRYVITQYPIHFTDYDSEYQDWFEVKYGHVELYKVREAMDTFFNSQKFKDLCSQYGSENLCIRYQHDRCGSEPFSEKLHDREEFDSYMLVDFDLIISVKDNNIFIPKEVKSATTEKILEFLELMHPKLNKEQWNLLLKESDDVVISCDIVERENSVYLLTSTGKVIKIEKSTIDTVNLEEDYHVLWKP